MWAVHVAHMLEVRNEQKLLFRKPEGRNHSEDVGLDRKIILEWILWK
jgi:hypothetical protein